MVASTKTDKSLGTVEIPHDGEEEYENIWQKVRSMWSYIYDNYYEEYDWFHIGGEDMFLIPENLRLYVESEEIMTASNGGIFLPHEDTKKQTPLFLGCRMAYEGDQKELFNQGGSGYTMNKAALKMLVVGGFPNYFTDAHTFKEDVTVAAVLRQFHVHPYDTTDDQGGQRFMPYSPGFHYDFRQPETHGKGWYASYALENADYKEGVDHCAARSVSFHYIKPDLMYRLYALLYHICPLSMPSIDTFWRDPAATGTTTS